MKKHIFLALILSAALYAEEEQKPLPPEVIEKQLEDAEREFEEAKNMFDPWYSGPIVTGSGHVLKKGKFKIQPYLYVTKNFAKYDENAKSHFIPHLLVVNPFFNFQAGFGGGWEGVASTQTISNRREDKWYTNIGDSAVGLNYGIQVETPYRPAIKVGVNQTFPTGNYQKLDGDLRIIQTTGMGAYQTNISFNVSKVVWWIGPHPMNFRTSLNYNIFSHVHVKGFNAYGGGFGTNGSVKPGNSFTGNFGYEYSFTQNWVAAVDFTYTYNSSTTFKGDEGTTAAGTSASVGGPFNDSLSIVPAIEYNPSPALNMVLGAWLPMWGRNSLNFISGIYSISWVF